MIKRTITLYTRDPHTVSETLYHVVRYTPSLGDVIQTTCHNIRHYPSPAPSYAYPIDTPLQCHHNHILYIEYLYTAVTLVLVYNCS